MRRCTLIFLLSGLAIVTLGIVFGMVIFPHVLHKKIKQQIRLERGGELYNKWVDVKIPIYMKVYFFNITNPAEFSEGEKPILQEVGPWIYQQRRQKVVLLTNPENDTVQFRPKITYFFRANMSQGRTEEDVLNFVNVPLLSVISKAMSMGGFARSLIKGIVDDHAEELFVQKTVGELLFKGYDEPMIRELSEFQGEEIMPDNQFGFYYGKNGTAQDLFEIYSGIVENEKFGMTISWKGRKDLDFWGSKYCNMINGSDGSIFPPFISRDRVIRIFSPDMCRSIYMTYHSDVELKGVPAYRFTTPKEVMQDPRIEPENVCYCSQAVEDEDFDQCSKAGVFRIGACRKGAPIVASWPHFFDGDAEYLNQSLGLRPHKMLHETFLSLEPNTGALLAASKRFQINIEIKPARYFANVKKIPSMVLPLLWVDESVSLTDENADMLRAKLLTPLKVGSMGMFGLLGLGAILIVIAFVFIIFPCGGDNKGDKR
ncbi:lysosome membrane protein 2 [Folsomia candida]|uniref:Scavenger receptor class B member 1 n=1 Tax=Folsomia candida TaxID=158441 RepID=A0A226D6T4_FOLCA|nr:lysosome membrane protein 2 [Folsomia candida]OXA40564.1 Lysosome membrane protein 2 [Folsomia candida]